MRLNRPPGVASNPEPAGGHRTGAGVVRVLSVTAAAGAVCAMSALPAMASPAADPGPVATTTTITSPANDVYSYVNAGQAFTLTATVAPSSATRSHRDRSVRAVDDPDPVPPNMECTATAVTTGLLMQRADRAADTWGFLLYQATYTPTAGSEWTTSNSANTGDHKLVTWDITSTLLTFNPSPATADKAVTLTADVTDEPMDDLASAVQRQAGPGDLLHRRRRDSRVRRCRRDRPVERPGQHRDLHLHAHDVGAGDDRGRLLGRRLCVAVDGHGDPYRQRFLPHPSILRRPPRPPAPRPPRLART